MSPEKQVLYDRKRHAERRKNGLCVNCGKLPSLKPFVACEQCRQKQKALKARLLEQRKRDGVCPKCGEHVPPPGLKICSGCSKKWRNRYWLSYGNKYRARRRRWWKIKYREQAKIYNRQKRQEIKRKVFEAYGGCRCVCCGEQEMAFLTIDHINGGGLKHRKRIGKTGGSFYRWLMDKHFPEGYRVLCSNCNGAIGKFGSCPHQVSRPECAL